MLKLAALSIIKDEDIDTLEKAQTYYGKMINELDYVHQQRKEVIPHLFACYFAKVYVNYHWVEIMSSKSFDVQDLYRFYKEKLESFLDNVCFDLPYLEFNLRADISRLLDVYAKKHIQAFHHDFLPYNISTFLPFELEDENTMREYLVAYKHVVLGTKMHLVETFKQAGDSNE